MRPHRFFLALALLLALLSLSTDESQPRAEEGGGEDKKDAPLPTPDEVSNIGWIHDAYSVLWEGLLLRHPVVGVLGARQVGKTALAADIASRWKGPVPRFDLEDTGHRARLADPKLALQDLKGLVVLDEVQHLPDLFPLAARLTAVPLARLLQDVPRFS